MENKTESKIKFEQMCDGARHYWRVLKEVMPDTMRCFAEIRQAIPGSEVWSVVLTDLLTVAECDLNDDDWYNLSQFVYDIAESS